MRLRCANVRERMLFVSAPGEKDVRVAYVGHSFAKWEDGNRKTLRAIAAVALSVTVSQGIAVAAERVALEPVAYANNAAAAAAWQPLEGFGIVSLGREKTPDGRPTLALPCDMSRFESRVYWDRSVNLDLSRFGRISFWAKASGDEAAISGGTLYFNAGAGWYGAQFGFQSPGWNRVVLDRASFIPEGTPDGWQAIRAIRISFWKGRSTRATVYLGGMEATSSDVAIVRNARVGREASGAAEQMAAAMTRAGIDAGTVDDADVERGALAGKRIAVYPNNPQISSREMDAVTDFVRGGGRLLVCFSLPERMGKLLGVQPVGYLRQERPGQFSEIRLLKDRLPGLPTAAKQASWNIERVRPNGRNARVIATWSDLEGHDTGYPAIVLGDNGAYISHVLLGDDAANKSRILRGLLGHLCPDIWRSAADRAMEQAGRLGGRAEAFDVAIERVWEVARQSKRVTAVRGDLATAQRSYDLAVANRRDAHYAEAVESSEIARSALVSAYCLAQSAKSGEFRAAWCHSAYGVEGMTWDQAIKRLKDNGFTAVVPNMLWGGVADYRSDVMPVRDRVAKEGDQIALCVAAGKKYGVQVHVWKVNWNLGGAPESFIQRMRSEGRLQRSDAGVEEPWLCPSNSANFELERDSMLEVARKYAVSGIHFDYIRYPDSSHCYCDGCRARFEAQEGAPVATWPRDVLRGGGRYAGYQEFRRANITRLVKAVSEESHRIRPGIKVSAAVFSDWPQCREHVGQDWGAWVRAGYLDFVCPMDYTDSDSGFRSRILVQQEAVDRRIPLVPGIGVSAPGLPLAQVIDQIRIARELGTSGFILFNFDAAVAGDYIPALGRGITKPQPGPASTGEK